MATEPAGQIRTPNVQETLNNLGQNRRLVMIGASVVTVFIALVIIVFVWSRGASKGGQIDLVKGIDQGRAFEIISKLKSDDLEANLSDSEFPGKVNVSVFEKEFDKAAITLARSDLLQEDGFNLFDKSDWAASDYDKRIKMARAVNGDLSRIVSRMYGIKWATVRVNIPEPQLFSQFQAATTATVQVELPEEEVHLSRAQVRSIINLLVGYVPNLQNSNVSIIDTNGKTYSAVETEQIAASELIEESERVNKMVQNRIEEYLGPLLGTGNFIVRVSSEISRRKIEESATTFEKGVVGQEQIGDERVGGQGGPDAVGPPIPGADGGKSYSRSNRVTQQYPSFKQKTVTTPPGRVTKISVAVAINRDLLPGISTKQLREGIAAITSPATTINDVKITVAEFASSKIAPAGSGVQAPIVMPDIRGFFSKLVSNFSKMPRWASITIIVIGLLVVLGSLKKPAPIRTEAAKTVSQINQAMQKQQFQRPEAQIPAQVGPMQEQTLGLTAQKPDLSGILTGFKEAATEKPDVLASRLQIWLEEGTTAARM